jgi:AraC family transcriptional regulator of adaptative response/methylated-DNA-[protein]-cysteine methyltransferase
VTAPFATPTESQNGAERWRAVETRDGAARTTFVFAVITTGIFCRPGCPSRRPRRENVVFFDTPDQARAAGYRPCRRCRPEEGGAQTAVHDAAVASARHRLETETPAPGLAELAAEAGLSPGHFQRVFKAMVGLSPKRYALAARAHRLREALGAGATVTDALYDAGYGGPARAHAESDGVLGMTASAYRRGGAGEIIDHVTAPCALGLVLVAATARGICAVQPADVDQEPALLESLRARFPKATFRPDGPAARALLPLVLALIERPGQAGGVDDLPLDLCGTAFQLRVWAELRRIPPGETRTYAEVAAAIGHPAASRAVANACGANPAAAVVPCHRVVRGDGGLGGYRWGLDRKRALLDREGAESPPTSGP